jgi:hypothetical protein
LRRVAERFPQELVVIGVHSPKFPAERETPNLAAAVARHQIQHPVVNDRQFAIWQAYGARAWPTVVLIDPQGYVLAQHAGEVSAEELGAQLEDWIAEYRERGALTEEPLPFAVAPAAPPSGLLAFPAKVAVAGARAWLADTDHHRVLELELHDHARRATLRTVFGSGEAGMADGAGSVARFRRPHGVTVHGSRLYVADTENHSLRGIDLETGVVHTLAGTGEMARRLVPPRGGDPRDTPLRSPWDVLAVEDVIFIAMAGSHQVWVLMEERELLILAGNGREALVDGPVAEASFNQPSGLALARNYLFVADAEASAVRAVALVDDARVMTVVGQGLFEFGDVDGVGPDVRLQHAAGISWGAPYLWLADTYNDKVKRLDPESGEVVTFAGGGGSGRAGGDGHVSARSGRESVDGRGSEATFAGPQGIAAGDGWLLVADTDHHLLRRVDLTTAEVTTVEIEVR